MWRNLARFFISLCKSSWRHSPQSERQQPAQLWECQSAFLSIEYKKCRFQWIFNYLNKGCREEVIWIMLINFHLIVSGGNVVARQVDNRFWLKTSLVNFNSDTWRLNIWKRQKQPKVHNALTILCICRFCCNPRITFWCWIKGF